MTKIEVCSVNIARLISELEGVSMLTKWMGFQDDMITINQLKKKYYSLYFKLKQQENIGELTQLVE